MGMKVRPYIVFSGDVEEFIAESGKSEHPKF